MKDSRITIRLDQETRKKLNKLCDEHGYTISELLREVIKGLINKNEKK